MKKEDECSLKFENSTSLNGKKNLVKVDVAKMSKIIRMKIMQKLKDLIQ